MRHWSISASEETHMNMVIGLAQVRSRRGTANDWRYDKKVDSLTFASLSQANEIEQMLRSFDTLTTLTVKFSPRVLEAAVAACGRAGRLEG